jgi:hypothetical protein
VSDAAIGELVALLERVRARSRSTWPALVVAHADDEAHGHEAFALLEVGLDAAIDDDAVIESSPRLRISPGAPFELDESSPELFVSDAPIVAGDDEAPLLEIVGDRPIADLAHVLAGAGAHAVRSIDDEPLGLLVATSLALRPRSDAW